MLGQATEVCRPRKAGLFVRLAVGRAPSQLFEVGTHGRSGVVPAEHGIEGREYVTRLIPRVVALALELHRPDGRSVARHLAYRIGQPDLAADAGRHLRKDFEDLGLQDVAVDRG